MTIRTTRYSPDTCDCIIEYTWDDTIPEDSIVLTLDQVKTRCAAHAGMANNTDVYTTVTEENSRKNLAHRNLLDNGPNIIYDIDASSGTRVFKKGIRISWNWTGTVPNRMLTITLTGITLTTNQRNNAQTALNTRFGVGRVTLVNT
jgi:hypothetical protein